MVGLLMPSSRRLAAVRLLHPVPLRQNGSKAKWYVVSKSVDIA